MGGRESRESGGKRGRKLGQVESFNKWGAERDGQFERRERMQDIKRGSPAEELN
jgi:hypothetical protein